MTQYANTDSAESVEAVAIGAALTISGTAGKVENADAATEQVVGVAVTSLSAADVTAGKKVTYQMNGEVDAVKVDGSGTAIAKWTRLSPSTTDGVLVAHAGTNNHSFVAVALEAATTAKSIRALLIPGSLPDGPAT